MKNRLSFIVILLLFASCEKNEFSPVKEYEILNQSKPYQYDSTNVREIIRLADIKLYNKIYNEKNTGTQEIHIDYSGKWWEDHQHATCVPPRTICWIGISDIKPDPEESEINAKNKDIDLWLIKVLPDSPEIIKISEVSTTKENGIVFVKYQ